MKLEYRGPRVTACCGVSLALMLAILASVGESQEPVSPRQLVDEFQNTPVFWEQFEIAQRIVALRDPSVLPQLASWLSREDRHQRGNAAFIFASLGDQRGFDVIRSILDDRSWRPAGQGIGVVVRLHDAPYNAAPQIATDRYYAAHLLGDLKDARAVPILVQLLGDEEVNYIVPWSLAEIGDKRAVAPLIRTLADKNPSMRVLAIDALEKLRAKEALPELHLLLNDNEKSNFGDLVSVAEAAKAAIANLEAH